MARKKSSVPPFIVGTMRRISQANNAVRAIQFAFRRRKAAAARAARARRVAIMSFKRKFGFRNPYL